MYVFNPFKFLLHFNLNVILRLLRDRPGQPWLYTLSQTWTPIINSIASCAMSMDVRCPVNVAQVPALSKWYMQVRWGFTLQQRKSKL